MVAPDGERKEPVDNKEQGVRVSRKSHQAGRGDNGRRKGK